MSNPYGLTDIQIANLTKLAAYLEKLPADYEHFDMETYINYSSSLEEGTINDYMRNNGGLYAKCGSAGCALGHGPEAGILAIEDDFNVNGDTVEIDWEAYTGHFVHIGHQDLDQFLFGGAWENFDNTHYGAAARIRFILDGNPIPEGWVCKHSIWNKEEWEDYVPTYTKYRIDA